MTAATPTVSVVVATHNRADQLAALLDGLARQTRLPDQVVVVDDGSVDETAATLAAEERANRLPLEVVTNESAAGPATARELGWRRASGDAIAFTDDDCVPDPGWLEAALAAWGATPHRFVQGRTEPEPGVHIGPFSRTIRVSELDLNFHTCNIVYPRALLERIDGFDTRTFGRAPGGEDCDLGWRAIAAGAQPVFAPDALVHHAVNDLGPFGKLRVAARWATPLRAYAMHPELRRATFTHGVFWRRTHWWLLRALCALAVPRVLLPLALWLVYPYARNVWARGRVEGGGPALAPYFVVHDLVEIVSAVRAGIHTRTLML